MRSGRHRALPPNTTGAVMSDFQSPQGSSGYPESPPTGRPTQELVPATVPPVDPTGQPAPGQQPAPGGPPGPGTPPGPATPPAPATPTGPRARRGNGLAITAIVLSIIAILSVAGLAVLVANQEDPLARLQRELQQGVGDWEQQFEEGIAGSEEDVQEFQRQLDEGLREFQRQLEEGVGNWEEQFDDAFGDVDSDPPDGSCDIERFLQDPDC